MNKGDFIIYDPVGMLKKIAADTSDAKRRARTETGKNEVIENMTFKEWIKNKK